MWERQYYIKVELVDAERGRWQTIFQIFKKKRAGRRHKEAKGGGNSSSLSEEVEVGGTVCSWGGLRPRKGKTNP